MTTSQLLNENKTFFYCVKFDTGTYHLKLNGISKILQTENERDTINKFAYLVYPSFSLENI